MESIAELVISVVFRHLPSDFGRKTVIFRRLPSSGRAF
jgi:hypothetical protein